MLPTDVRLHAWSGLELIATIRAGMLEVEVRLHVSPHVVLVFVFLATMITVPHFPPHSTMAGSQRAQHKIFKN